MEPWTPIGTLRWSLKCALGRLVTLGRHAFATMFVDAALDVFRYRARLFMPGKHKVRSVVIPPSRHTQQSAELWGLCWAVRLAKRLGWRFLVLVTDSHIAGAQMVSLRAAEAEQALAVHCYQDDTVWAGSGTALGVHGISAGRSTESP